MRAVGHGPHWGPCCAATGAPTLFSNRDPQQVRGCRPSYRDGAGRFRPRFRRTKKPGAFRPRVFPIGAACAAPSQHLHYTAPAAVCQTGLPPRRATGCRQRWPQSSAPAPTGAGGGWGLLPTVRCPLAAAIAGRPASGVRPAAFAVYRKMKSCADVIMLHFMDNSRLFHECG